jgi:hypothetical protein
MRRRRRSRFPAIHQIRLEAEAAAWLVKEAARLGVSGAGVVRVALDYYRRSVEGVGGG